MWTPGTVPVRASARILLLIALAFVAVGTVVGLVQLWPSEDPRADGPENDFAAPGVTFMQASVELVQPACERPEPVSLDRDSGELPRAVLRGRLGP